MLSWGVSGVDIRASTSSTTPTETEQVPGRRGQKGNRSPNLRIFLPISQPSHPPLAFFSDALNKSLSNISPQIWQV